MANFNLENYIPVNERLGLFYKDHPNGRVTTELIQHDIESGFVMFKACAFRDREDAEPSATGHAFEERTQGYVNKTSYIENCETSAVGRALALLGYEISKGIASREEIAKVKRYEQNDGNHASRPPQQKQKPQDKPIAERIKNVQNAIVGLNGMYESPAKGESPQDYFNSLVDQYNRLKAGE